MPRARQHFARDMALTHGCPPRQLFWRQARDPQAWMGWRIAQSV